MIFVFYLLLRSRYTNTTIQIEVKRPYIKNGVLQIILVTEYEGTVCGGPGY